MRSTEFRNASTTKGAASAPPEECCCPIVELRQYTLRPGMRDILIDLFDREFVESQEALGMSVLGQFRDLDDPNRFIWLRGFADMASRAQALSDFYHGPIWRLHREVANATMVDSDNVLLLRPAVPTSGFHLGNLRPTRGSCEVSQACVTTTIYSLDPAAGKDFVEFFERMVRPVLLDSGASVLAYFVTEPSPNTFPALPVREGESVFVWFSCFRNRTACDDYFNTLSQSPRWCGEVSEQLTCRQKSPPEVLKLSPTARSLLRC